MLMTCDVAKCRVVGSADPHPKIVNSNFSMPSGYEFHCTKLLQKSEMRKEIVIELSYKGFSRASDYS